MSRRCLLDAPTPKEIDDSKDFKRAPAARGNLLPNPPPRPATSNVSKGDDAEAKESVVPVNVLGMLHRRRKSVASDGSGGGNESAVRSAAAVPHGSFRMKGKSRRLSITAASGEGIVIPPTPAGSTTIVAGGAPKLTRSRRFSTAVTMMMESNAMAKKGSLERADSRRNLLKLTKPLSIKEVVRFGDIACFADLEIGGLLCGNSRLYDTLFVDAQMRFEPSNSIHMQEECCFVILQKFQYTAMKSFEKLLQYSNVSGVTLANWKYRIHPSNPVHADLRSLKSVIDGEQETNELESKRMLGEPVAYGSVVQLRHRISGKFLTQTKNRAEHDASAMEVALMEGGAEGSWWKVLPADKLRSEGEWVQYSDRLHFENMKHRNSYITISASHKKDGREARGSLAHVNGSMKNMMSKMSHAECMVLHPSAKARYEVNASPFISSLQIIPFQMSDLTGNHAGPGKLSIHHVHGLDIITLCHRDSEKLLMGDEVERCATWVPASGFKEGRVNPSALWKVQMRFVELGGHAVPLVSSEVLLQHVQTGLYLCSENGCAVLTSDLYRPNCMWSFSLLHTGSEHDQNFVSHGKMIWLKSSCDMSSSSERMSWLSIDSDYSGTPVRTGTISVFGSTKGTNSDALMREGAWLENEDLLEISIVDESFAASVKDIVQTRDLFKAMISAIKEAEPIPDDLSVYDKVMMCIGHPVHDMLRRSYNIVIKGLDSLVCSCTASTDDDPFTRQGPPRTAQQDLLRQLGMIDAAMQLAESVFKDLNVPLSPVAKIPAIFQVVRRCYLLIERACLDNVSNKKNMLPYVTTIESHLEVQVGAYFAMMVIFSDTRELLESVDKDRMRKVVASIKNCKSDLWARFLVQTCHEGDQPIRKNQNLLTELILIEAPELIFRTNMTDDDVLLTSEGEHVTEFSVKSLIRQVPSEDELFDTTHDDISPIRGAVCQKPRDLFRYHMTMMELLGWLVHGRNPWASQVLAENAARFGIEFSQLVRIMNRRELPFTYRTRACELIKRLYVDQDPHQSMTMLRRTRIWTKLIQTSEDLSRSSSAEGLARPTDTAAEPHAAASTDVSHAHDSSSRSSRRRKGSLPNTFQKPSISNASTAYYLSPGAKGRSGSPVLDMEDYFNQQPVHTFRDTNFSNLKMSLADLIRSGENMNPSNCRRNVFLSSLVNLVTALSTLGFYHKYDTGIQDWGLRFREVRQIVANLQAAVDPRTDILRGSGSDDDLNRAHSKMDDRLEMNPMNSIVIEGKIKILEVIQTFLRCSDNERMTDFQKFWERMLQQVLDESGKFGAAVGSVPEEIARLSWTISPPWTEAEVKAFSDRIFSDEYNILPAGKRASGAMPAMDKDASPSRIGSFERTSSWGNQMKARAPVTATTDLDWSAIMMSLLPYPSHRLKELAFKGLIAHFRPASYFLLQAFDLQIIYSPKLADVLADVCTDVAVMRRNVKYIVGGTECTDQGQAHSTWMSILAKWSKLCTVTLEISRQDVIEVQNVLSNVGAVDIVTDILKLPMGRLPNQGFGCLDQPADKQQCRLFDVVYAFLARVCDRHAYIQKKLLPLLDHFCSHLGIEGLNVEEALSSLLRDNHEMVALKGRGWIKMFFEDIIAHYRCQRAEWLDGLHAMIRVGKKAIVEHQALTMVLFRRYENVTAVFMRTPRECDLRIDIMVGLTEDAHQRREELAYLQYSLAVIRLLSVCCEGKNPAAEVYAARYLSLQDIIRSIVKINVRSNGEVENDVDLVLACRVKTDYLNFLHDVYSQTNVTRLVEELQRYDNGIWSSGGSARSRHTSHGGRRSRENLSLMKCLLQDLRLFVRNVSLNLQIGGGIEAEAEDSSDTDLEGEKSKVQRRLYDAEMEAMRTYMFTSVFRFLGFYFKARYTAVRGSTSDDELISGKIYALIRRFYNLPLTGKEACVFIDGEMVSGHEMAGEVLKFMGQKTRRTSAGEIFSTTTGAPQLPSAFPVSAVDSGMSLASIRVGYRVFSELVAAQYQITQFKELSRTGVKKLALLFSSDAEADLGTPGAAQGTRNLQKNPTYNELLGNILELCNHDSTSTQTLTDVLRLIRATMYFYEPHYEPKVLPQKIMDHVWKLFLNDDPMEKFFGPKEEILSWVQNKYDAMGATEAALRLSAHSSPDVRTSAIRLLLTLLQTGNEVVQQAVYDYFVTTKDTRFFKSAHDTLGSCMENLKDFKKNLKRLKKNDHSDDMDGGRSHPSVIMAECAAFGRKSEVMITLRLIQLMCEGQYRPMQDMMFKQPVDTASFDLLRKCIDLVETLHPLLNESLSFNMGDLTVLVMQVVETISETVQGPNFQNQKYILSSKFLAVVNRVFSTITYSPVDASMKVVDGMGGSINDLKCWLKTSLLNCCHAILEGVGDEKRSSRALEFFELRNFEIQMVSIGQLLELVDIGAVSLSTSLNSVPNQQILQPMVGRRSSLRAPNLMTRVRSFDAKRPSTVAPEKAERDIKLIVSTLHFAKGWKAALENELFSMYFLLVVMAEHDSSGAVHDWLLLQKREYPTLYKYLIEHSSHVELSREGEDSPTEKVYFRMDSKVIELTKNEDFKARTDTFIFDVPRENPHEKTKVFLQKSKQVLLMVSLLRGMTGSDVFGLSEFFVQRRDLVDSTARRLAGVITCLLLLFYGIPVDPNTGSILGGGKFYTVGHNEPWYKDECYAHADLTSHPDTIGASIASMMDYSDLSLQFRLKLQSRWESSAEWEVFPPGRALLVLLAFLHVCVTIINSIIQLTLDFPLLYRECMEGQDHISEMVEEGSNVPNSKKQAKSDIKGLKKPLMAMPAPQTLQSKFIFSRQVRTLLYQAIQRFWYSALKVFISLLGFYNSPFFFPVYLLDYFKSSIGHMVLHAVIVGGPNLFRSFVLAIIVIVVFGFNSYAFFSQSVNVNQQLCHSPFQCVVKHVLDSMTGDLTTVIGDDFGNFANPSVAPWQDLWHTWRSLTVFVSLVFWVFLLLGIMQGQIIDAFAEMRDKDKAAKDDLSSNCFISSLDRHTFSEYPGEWEKRKDGKFAWNYLHYFCYLQQKDPEEYSGLENSVSEAYAEMSTEFLPIGKFYAGQNKEELNMREHAIEMLHDHVQEAKAKLVTQDKAIREVKTGLEENTRLLREMFSAFDQQTELLQKLVEKANQPDDSGDNAPNGRRVSMSIDVGGGINTFGSFRDGSSRGSRRSSVGSVAPLEEHVQY